MHAVCSPNQGLSEYQRRASWLQTGPSPPHQRKRGRLATTPTGRQGAISEPEMASTTKLWGSSMLLTKSHWDPGHLTSDRRVVAWDQLPRGDTWHTWDSTIAVHSGNWVARTGEVIKMHSPLGTVSSPSTRSPDLLGPGKSTKHMAKRVCAFVEYPRTWTWAA